MSIPFTRRRFLQSTAAMAATGLTRGVAGAVPQSDAGVGGAAAGPVVVASANGLAAVSLALDRIRGGADPLEAVVAGVNLVERDPNDHSVGYGGLPNEDGVVELDSCVMHGPTHNAGAVAALRNIKTPSSVAKLVMERTDHVLLVGEGALRFAKAHGFEEQNLLTDRARRMWLRWKELRQDDDWFPPAGGYPDLPPMEARAVPGEAELFRRHGVAFTYGTINCCALDGARDLAGVTTTSGLSYKLPGRVGDSPIIGAGLYVDNEFGAAGATGRGEAVILNSGSHLAVELMGQGRSPTEACTEALRRIHKRTRVSRLLDAQDRPKFNVCFYAVRKDGLYGSASIWSGVQFSVATAAGARLEPSTYLYVDPEAPQTGVPTG